MSRCTTTTINGQSCVVCTEQPYIAPVPAQTIIDPNIGWNSSAYSAANISGDCYTQFMLPDCIGTVVGLAPDRTSNDPRDIPHGFYIYEAGGRRLWSVSEGGVEKTTPVVRVAGTDVFRIERRERTVSYFHNGKRVYVSDLPSVGDLVVTVCMYVAYDAAPAPADFWTGLANCEIA